MCCALSQKKCFWINSFVMNRQQQSVEVMNPSTTVRICESLNKLPYVVIICEQMPLTCQVMQLKVSNISFCFLLRRSNFMSSLIMLHLILLCVVYDLQWSHTLFIYFIIIISLSLFFFFVLICLWLAVYIIKRKSLATFVAPVIVWWICNVLLG